MASANESFNKYFSNSSIAFRGLQYDFKTKQLTVTNNANTMENMKIEEFNNISEEPINNLLGQMIPDHNEREEFKVV